MYLKIYTVQIKTIFFLCYCEFLLNDIKGMTYFQTSFAVVPPVTPRGSVFNKIAFVFLLETLVEDLIICLNVQIVADIFSQLKIISKNFSILIFFRTKLIPTIKNTYIEDYQIWCNRYLTQAITAGSLEKTYYLEYFALMLGTYGSQRDVTQPIVFLNK